MARPDHSAEIELALLRDVERHPTDLVAVVATQLGLTRAAVAPRARSLVAAGYLEKTGTTRPTYRLGRKRSALIELPLRSLAEDQVWTRDVAPLLHGLPSNVIDIAQYGVTEMVNNAIDHSEGRHLHVFVERDDLGITLMVADDGVGIFRKISAALDLPDQRLALLELSKGKLTTDPRRHSGEGVFFASRFFDRFQILSGDLLFDHVAIDGDKPLYDFDQAYRSAGTRVLMEIATDATRTTKQVIDQFSSGPDEYAFAKTVVPVRLARVGDETLVARSQAKRLLQRVDRFRVVVLDFEGVRNIGQAFADEIFRVFANQHPAVELMSANAVPDVQQMIRRAEVLRGEGGDAESLH